VTIFLKADINKYLGKNFQMKFSLEVFIFLLCSANVFAAEQQNQAVHPLTKTLSDFGATNCTQRANQIANFLSGKTNPDLVVQTPAVNPNSSLLMATMVVPLPEKKYALTSISLAPNQANGCGGSYHSVFYSNKLCAKAFLDNYPNVKFQPINKTNIQIGVVNRGLWIIGMPAEKGCILMKEEVVE
jgi:hypothetical protein